MTGRVVWTVPVGASPSSVHELADALRRATDGSGPAVRPVAAAGPTASVPDTPVPDGVAVVVATSGSSGDAKHVLLTAEALRASASATERRLGGPGRWLLALPAEHVAGVQVVLRALLAGAAPVVQDLTGGFRPDGFASAATELPVRARRYTSLVPTQIARILDTGPGAPLDSLVSFDAVLVGGAALDPGLRRRAEDAGVSVVTTYGMSETCGGCVYDGVALDGVTVDIESPDPTGAGRIVLGGAVVAAGYIDPVDDNGAFDGGRFRTGDLGRLDGGRLTVLGRVDDMINTGGEKVAPAAVERALLGVPGVRAACVTGLDDAEWGQIVAALVVADGGADDDTLRSAVRSASGRAAVPRVLRRVERIPERGIGKPDRAAVARLLSGDGSDTLRTR
ncbi:o-succinylbenzoate--CoA ligase [Pseudonocardia endophytica]|uniref:O-succinylbenzoic acid--CoA ligase n=1 Tax=Pseudonocardia endophytica TaxID=401976 RepID=A0A4R1HHF9_PSEEN|nr:o-succinylbenzoate--CoA ligase [Pseudonocardia endophytica]TCK20213.1 O-succinylbenzoic acid--CoA ligase [Pseudonocardia endophytica]